MGQWTEIEFAKSINLGLRRFWKSELHEYNMVIAPCTFAVVVLDNPKVGILNM